MVQSIFNLIMCTLFVGSSAITLLSESALLDRFHAYQIDFGKNYPASDHDFRFKVFRDNFENILSHNSNNTRTFDMAVNKFTDMTPDEFKFKMVGGYRSDSAGSTACDTFVSTGKSVPDSIDWRIEGAVTPVKDQGQCGSCWSFSATGALEGAWAVGKGRKLVSLSEQQLVDCAGIRYGSMGCNGGLMEGAFNYAIDKGMCTEDNYPYTSGETQTGGTCHTCASVVKVSKCFSVKTNDQLALKEAVSNSPVSIAIEADTRYFQSYSSGVLTSTTCGTTLDHGVLIVGYGEEDGQKYWLVKNSWGSGWGDSGYVKIARSESSNDGGVCGISMGASFVVV